MSIHNPFLSLDQKIIGDVYTSRESWDNLLTLCDNFGARFSGTPQEKEAAHFLRDKFSAYGLQNVQLEPFDYLGWQRGDVQFEIISPIQRTIDCITLPHSPPAQQEGTIIDLGDGAPNTFDEQAEAIKGNIVMSNSVMTPGNVQRWVHRSEKYGRSALAGATGFIFVNHYPGFGPATGGIGNKYGPAPIPGISISYEDGAFIQRLLKQHGQVHVKLQSSDQIKMLTSWNVTAELPGHANNAHIVLLGSHYDGHDIAQGAGDPASGTAAVLEAARVLSQHATNLPHTIRFAMWGVEELGLYGSKAYIHDHEAELDNIRLYFNMDSAGIITPKDIFLSQWPTLTPLFQAWQQAMALDFQVWQSSYTHSDHYPFLLAGVPTGGIKTAKPIRSGRGYGHTRYDTVDKVTMKGIQEAAVLGARIALRIATTETWPARRRDQAAVTAALDTPTMREETAIAHKLDTYYKSLTT